MKKSDSMIGAMRVKAHAEISGKPVQIKKVH